MNNIKTINELIQTLIKIKSVSRKQAEKIASFLLNASDEFSYELINKIEALKTKISFCQKCNFIVEEDKCLNCDRSDA
ncbi:UNVERIFIED_CONTAM: hypothetical protein O8I53_12060 [Campylobacter lari]